MGNVHMEATQVNYREGNKKMSVAEAIKNAGSEITPEEKTWIDSIPTLTTSNAGKTDQTVIAPEFDAEAGTYAIGVLVMHEGKLYEFTSAHETPGDWDETEVTEKTVSDEIDTLKSGLTIKQDTLLQTGLFNTETGSIETGITMQKFISAYSANWDSAYCYVRRKSDNTAIIDVKDVSGNVITNTNMAVVVNYLP